MSILWDISAIGLAMFLAMLCCGVGVLLFVDRRQ